MPFLSIITINFNNKNGLKKTIDSVLSQNSNQIQHIIIDGGSTDGSVDLLKNLNHENILWKSESDKGIYDAQNKGVLISTGEYTLFLNSGDILATNSIVEEMMTLINGEDIVYGNLITNEKGKKINHQGFEEASVTNLMISTIWHPCAFIKRSLFVSSGLYNIEFKLAGDFEFFVRCILKDGATTKFINKFISEFDMTGVSNKSENEKLLLEERESAWKLNFSEPMLEFFKKSVNLQRSREYKLGKRLSKFFPG